jgi:predicted P-loop ATPase/GTPase
MSIDIMTMPLSRIYETRLLKTSSKSYRLIGGYHMVSSKEQAQEVDAVVKEETLEQMAEPAEQGGGPLAEVLGRMEQAYTAYISYISAQKEVGKVYKDNEKQVEKAYKTAERQANNAYDEAIQKALKAHEALEQQAEKAYQQAKEQAKKAYEENVAEALNNRREAIDRAWSLRTQTIEQAWNIFNREAK